MIIGVTYTNNGADWTGLSPTINIYDAKDDSKVVDAVAVSEIAEGGYKYIFAAYDPSKDYYWKIDGGEAITNNKERYRRGWSGLAGAVPDAQAGVNGGLPTVNASNLLAGIQGTKNTLDDLTDITAAQVNAEVVDAINIDTYAEPGQEKPPATTNIVKKIGHMYKFFRNKNTRDASSIKTYNDDGNQVDQKAIISDDGATYTKGEYESGP